MKSKSMFSWAAKFAIIIISLMIASFTISTWKSEEKRDLIIGEIAIASVNCDPIDSKLTKLEKYRNDALRTLDVYGAIDKKSDKYKTKCLAYESIHAEYSALKQHPQIQKRDAKKKKLSSITSSRNLNLLGILLLWTLLITTIVYSYTKDSFENKFKQTVN